MAAIFEYDMTHKGHLFEFEGELIPPKTSRILKNKKFWHGQTELKRCLYPVRPFFVNGHICRVLKCSEDNRRNIGKWAFIDGSFV